MGEYKGLINCNFMTGVPLSANLVRVAHIVVRSRTETCAGSRRFTIPGSGAK